MKLIELPIIGTAIENTILYLRYSYFIIMQNKKFSDTITLLGDKAFSQSMKYFEWGIVVAVLYLVPFFVLHSQSMSKFVFMLQQVLSMILYTAFVYIAFRIINTKTVYFKKLMTIFGFLWGYYPLIVAYCILTLYLYDIFIITRNREKNCGEACFLYTERGSPGCKKSCRSAFWGQEKYKILQSLF